MSAPSEPARSTGIAARSSWLHRLILAGLGVLLVLALGLPVYSDEIAWRFQERAGYAPGLDTMLSDICGPASLARPPLFMMPVRLFSATINSWLDAPVFVRLAGVACALLFLVLLWRLASLALQGTKNDTLPVRTLVFAPLSMGTLPFLLVMSRPEQPLIIGATAAILLAMRLRVNQQAPDRWQLWLTIAAIVAIAAISLSYHLKGVLYAAIPCACLLACSKERTTLIPRLAGIAVIGAMAISAFLYWSSRFQCPGDPVMATKLARENVAALLANGTNPFGAIASMISGAVPYEYVLLTAPVADPMSSWLPPGLVGEAETIAFMALLMAVWASLAAASIWNLARFILSTRKAALLEPRVIIALALFAVIAIWGASQLNSNDYEAAHVLPMLAVACLLCLTLPAENPWLGCIGTRAAMAFPAAALASQLFIAATHGPALWKAAQATSYLPDQPVSVPVRGYDGLRAQIAEAMTKAGIPTDRPLYRPLIDDLTYLELQDSHLPLHFLGVLSVWNGSIKDPVAYLLSRKSDGIVVGCRYLPAPLADAASRVGDICAVSAATLKRLHGNATLPSSFAIPAKRR